MEKQQERKLDTDQKALEVNLNPSIYGTFAEIGAGQEVARYFFKVGAAAGTIAKTMSAYDKTYSDCIYGEELTGRYVCESRLHKMLDHEYNQLIDRLSEKMPGCRFFAFADTISALNYHRTNIGHGWLGIRFQTRENGPANELVIHARMKDNNPQLQSKAVGVLGVNMVYACFYFKDDTDQFIKSLQDHLKNRVVIDMIRISGPDFEHLDNRVLNYQLVQHRLTDVAMFSSEGDSLHASEKFYKKPVVVVRGNYKPPTVVTQDVFKTSLESFCKDHELDEEEVATLAEINVNTLGKDLISAREEFKERAEVLCALGYDTIITNTNNHMSMVKYFGEQKVEKFGLVIGVRQLLELINERYYQNQEGGLLNAFGELFTRKISLYTYPALQFGSNEIMNSKNLPVPNGIQYLYKFLLDSELIRDLENYNPDTLHIMPDEVLNMIRNNVDGWEKYIPSKLVTVIKEKCLFGYPCQRMHFEY